MELGTYSDFVLLLPLSKMQNLGTDLCAYPQHLRILPV